jgi:signal transduction histidine kinase
MAETVGARLIRAHDAERARISRLLHDDVSQQLAGLSIAISGFRQRVNGDAETQAAVTALQQMTIAAAETIRRVSNELHPSALPHVGLGMALSTLCREYSVAMQCPVSFDGADVRELAPDIAVSLYRTVDELLRNVKAHAGTTRVVVGVTQTTEKVIVTVRDNGCGFDTSAARRQGLGLVVVEERARMLGGECRIESEPGRGTRVSVAVPRVPPQ